MEKAGTKVQEWPHTHTVVLQSREPGKAGFLKAHLGAPGESGNEDGAGRGSRWVCLEKE